MLSKRKKHLDSQTALAFQKLLLRYATALRLLLLLFASPFASHDQIDQCLNGNCRKSMGTLGQTGIWTTNAFLCRNRVRILLVLDPVNMLLQQVYGLGNINLQTSSTMNQADLSCRFFWLPLMQMLLHFTSRYIVVYIYINIFYVWQYDGQTFAV